MKPVLIIVIFVLPAVLWFHLSCKKEHSCENCKGVNQPPVSRAGSDQMIILPVDSLILNGSASSDPDGTITKYRWTKISGPSSFHILYADSVRTPVSQVITGIYRFELKVTDNGGLSSTDTISVSADATLPANHQPVADAGQDFSVNYDLQTCSAGNITLNGSGSAGTGRTIVSFSWTQISGAAPAVIAHPDSAITRISDLSMGNYGFRLLVKDNTGVTGDDTVMVNVTAVNRPVINARLVPFGSLSQERSGMVAASAGNKIVFAGGGSSRVDIFDVIAHTWSTAELSQARSLMTAAVLGNRIFFAGGYQDGNSTSSRVDIYDAVSNTWAMAELSQDRVFMAAAAVGNKVLFAGGYSSHFALQAGFRSTVDIYDASSNAWSTASLSEPRCGLTASVAGNKIFFAGGTRNLIPFDYGSTSKIDIYDLISGTWSTSALREAKGFLAGIAVSNKIFWAGGVLSADSNYISNLVEIRDINTQTSSFACLFQPNYWNSNSVVQKNDMLIFFTGSGGLQSSGSKINEFDIYNLTTGTWSVGLLNENIQGSSIISFDNKIYVAAGEINGVWSKQVWTLEF